MRKVIMAVMFACFACVTAHAAVTTATFGDQGADKSYKLQADTDGVITIGTQSTFKNLSFVGGPIVALSATNTIMTAAQIMKNTIFQASTSGSYTLDTGTAMSAAVVPVSGEVIPFVISNPTSGIITVVAGSGFTLAGTFTVPTLTTRPVYATYLTTNSWTLN